MSGGARKKKDDGWTRLDAAITRLDRAASVKDLVAQLQPILRRLAYETQMATTLGHEEDWHDAFSRELGAEAAAEPRPGGGGGASASALRSLRAGEEARLASRAAGWRDSLG